MTKTSTETGSDIFAIANSRKPHEYEVIHPGTHKGMGLFITLISINEEAPQKVARKIQDGATKLARRNQGYSAEQVRENSINIIAACITGWRWGNDADGKPASAGGQQLEFNALNVRKVLQVDEIREQLDAELADASNFFQN